jgi:hypothetical protein
MWYAALLCGFQELLHQQHPCSELLCIYSIGPVINNIPACLQPNWSYPEVGQAVASLHILNSKADLSVGILLILDLATVQVKYVSMYQFWCANRIPTFWRSARETSKTRPFSCSDAIWKWAKYHCLQPRDPSLTSMDEIISWLNDCAVHKHVPWFQQSC